MHCQTEYPFYTANYNLISGMRDMSKLLHPSRFYAGNRSLSKETRYLSSQAKSISILPMSKSMQDKT